MICPDCHMPIPDFLLACMACVTKASHEAARRQQREPLRQVIAGKQDLITRAKDGRRHVQMFSHALTFCGLHVDERWRKNYIDPEVDGLEGVSCQKCKQEVLRAIEEARQT